MIIPVVEVLLLKPPLPIQRHHSRLYGWESY